jgi:HAD superfamily hydrolase (TIGR01549 family)
MIKAIIFDCYGVLVGTGFWNIYRRAGGNPDQDKAFIDDWLHRNSLGEVTGEGLTAAVARKLELNVGEWRQFIDEDEVVSTELIEFIRGELFGNYKLAVLSNAGRGSLQRKLSDDQMKLFDQIIVSAEVGFVKPDPAIFRLTAERLGVSPYEAVFIDDHVEYLEGARTAGMQTILYKDFASCRQAVLTLLQEEQL